MQRIILVLAVFTAMLASCKKEAGIPTSGTAIISTELFGTSQYYTYGFSFARATKVKYPGTSADLVAINFFSGEQGALTGAFLDCGPYNLNGISAAAGFGNAADALDYFNNYHQVTLTQFTEITDLLYPNCIFTYKSNSGNFAKILITAVSIDTTEVNNHFVEIEFRWQYQPDGTGTFP